MPQPPLRKTTVLSGSAEPIFPLSMTIPNVRGGGIQSHGLHREIDARDAGILVPIVLQKLDDFLFCRSQLIGSARLPVCQRVGHRQTDKQACYQGVVGELVRNRKIARCSRRLSESFVRLQRWRARSVALKRSSFLSRRLSGAGLPKRREWTRWSEPPLFGIQAAIGV